MFNDRFIFDLQRFVSISNSTANTLLIGTIGNDTIANYASNVTVNTRIGEDYIADRGSNVSLNAGAGNDIIYLDPANQGHVQNATITGGSGSDIFVVDPAYSNTISAVITDFTSEDIFVYDGDFDNTNGKWFTCYKENGNLVFSDDSNSSGEFITPTFIVTLQGVSSIEQISAARYYEVNGWYGSLEKSRIVFTTTIGENWPYGVPNIIKNETSSKKINGTAEIDEIYNSGDKVTINALGGDDSIKNNGVNVFIEMGAGNDTVSNSGSKATINTGDGADSIYNSGESVSVDMGTGNDYIDNGGERVTISGGAGDDYISNSGGSVTIAAGAGADLIDNRGSQVSIFASSGNDSIINWTGNVTINAGKGDDFIDNSGSQVVFMYSSGDGNDIIYGFGDDNTLQIAGTYSSKKSGSDVIVTVDNGQITLSGAASLSKVNISGEKASKNTWKLSGTTATYGTPSKTLFTIKGIASLYGIKLNGKVVTVSATSLGTNKVTISDGYTLKLGSDVSSSTTKKSWSFSNSTATYKQTTAAGYSLVDNEIIYSAAATKTLATVKGATTKSGLKVSGKTIKLAASALSSKVTVSGDYVFDFASDYSKATITGSSSDDTILARGKNIFVTGGKGSDIFEFKSTGTIGDYDSEDKVSLLSGAADITTNGDDVIFNGKVTLKGAADKSITYIEDGEEKVFKYTPAAVKFNAKGTSVTLLAEYEEDSFDTADYPAYANTVVTIKASAVQQPLEIFGNKKANKIVGTNEDDLIDGKTGSDTLSGGAGNDSLSGGSGNDSLWGGAGDDTLFGGAGKDIFVYKDGDGDDIISDYTTLDKIRVLSGDVSTPTVDSAGDVTFVVGDGEIVVKGSANKYIPVYDSGKNILMKYNPR